MNFKLILVVIAIVAAQWSALFARETDSWPFWSVPLVQCIALLGIVLFGRQFRGFGRAGVKDGLLAFGLAILAFIVVGAIYFAQMAMDLRADQSLYLAPGLDILWLGLYAVILTPILEEWLFRGVLLEHFRKNGPWMAIGFQALVFGAYHIEVAQIAPNIALGALLGWLAWKRGNLWAPILAHTLYNVLGFGAFLLNAHPPV